MSFLYPSFLFALIAVFIPLIIHLFNFYKKKRIYISTIRFLEQAKESKKHLFKLKDYLILAARMLFITFLVIAFAQPFFNTNKTVSSKSTKVVYIDNSLSTSLHHEGVSVLEQEINFAERILEGNQNQNQVFVISSNFDENKNYGLKNEVALDELAELKNTSHSKTFNEVIERVNTIPFIDKSTTELFFLSDFQGVDGNELNVDTSLKTNVIVFNQEEVSNVYVDSIWLKSPIVQSKIKNTLFVRLKNTGDAIDVNLDLEIDSAKNAVVEVEINENSVSVVPIDFLVENKQFAQAKLFLNDQPVSFDNEYYFTLQIVDEIKVAVIEDDQTNVNWSKMFENDELVKMNSYSVNDIDFDALVNVDFVIVNNIANCPNYLIQQTNQLLKQGIDVFIIPNKDLNERNKYASLGLNISYIGDTSLQETKITNYEDDFWTGVFKREVENINMPNANLNWHITNGSPLLSFVTNQKYITRLEKEEQGKLYFAANDLNQENGNLSKHALLVPLVYKMLLESKQSNKQLAYTNKDVLVLKNIASGKGQEVIQLKKQGSNQIVIPRFQPFGNKINIFLNALTENGVYEVLQQDSVIALIGVNYTKSESSTDFMSFQALKEIAKGSKQLLVLDGYEPLLLSGTNNSLSKEGSSLWKYCLFLAILFLLAEITIIKRL